ncbi:hypothetical protein [Ensifer sp. LC163]|uniref:hypothetical protein n=1 Tax=Ensifer sp. LC163 TaxID=1120652 RepID=UPI0008136497|nr:hypothetical protein [Ensifer sp. LC163]OCP37432.1 hypothetical protein BC360_22960 [Ensifer sp. LC163]
MTSEQNLMLYTKLAGFRLIAVAGRIACVDDFSRERHDRLIEGLEATIHRIQTVMALERQVLTDDEFAASQLEGEIEIFGRFAISLLDDVEIDYDTYEYRINGGRWINALMVDDSGVYVDYPELIVLTDEELGALAPIMRDITEETGIPVRAGRAIHGETRRLHPDYAVQDKHRSSK